MIQRKSYKFLKVCQGRKRNSAYVLIINIKLNWTKYVKKTSNKRDKYNFKT